MAAIQQLSNVQVFLLAAQFISDVNVESLQVLAAERKDVLTKDIIYRLLLTLYPTDEAARSALLALLESIRSDFDNVSTLDAPIDTSPVSRLSLDAVSQEAQRVYLEAFDSGVASRANSDFAKFLISWAHHIESSAGTLKDVLPLIQAFAAQDEELRRWAETYLGPIIRLQYDYYPEDLGGFNLRSLEAASGPDGIKGLLQHAAARSEHAEIARDLDEVVAPWIIGNHDTASWRDVFEWIFQKGVEDFKLASKALLDWDGPKQEDPEAVQEFLQTGFAIIYSSTDISDQNLTAFRAIYERSTSRAQIQPIDITESEPDIRPTMLSSNVTDASFLFNSLLSRKNYLTHVTEDSSSFLAGILKTTEILTSYKLGMPLPSVARICLSGARDRQKQEMIRILQQIPRLTTSEPDWPHVRRQLHWLRCWASSASEGAKSNEPIYSERSQPSTFLGRLPADLVETELLDAMLADGQYRAARDMFDLSKSQTLEASVVKDHVVAAIYSAFDNASNGNRNRGGIKRASDILAIFKPAFPSSTRLQAVDHLLKATHSLSFYHLTLQHGVPFRPVNIRAQKDPLSLIEKVLDQDQKAYAKLDDLVEVGRNLVLSRSDTPDTVQDDAEEVKAKVIEAEQRVTYAAILSALSHHDFDTAYSYITSRLLTTGSTQVPSGFVDDTSWRAVYAAGKYRPSSTPNALHSRISALSKRMELLSLALTLAPGAEPLSEILGTWRRCEEEMESLKSTALEEERAFEYGSNEGVPGGFDMDDRELDVAETRKAMAKRTLAGGSYEDEAPMGLFDMARGAASALRKNAFPLHAASGGNLEIQDTGNRRSGEFAQPSSPQEGDRVRKRDLVSNMVTSGLVSGMGWVLGAQPTERPGQTQ
ncbi:uncharacterized protein HMPREF1541_09328 [Cyphellophora europaea CBS 101466]|uniref:Sec39 domain-containing protein n=1 Tax=Cyphellophora europaea (strain CBS 101466) TaxID=1220924 RepID=W2S9U6_CYPE1|nr:uncharacterized protein HMPREF1541_09328 [Cyphellophora europaea CBS 101466]ETN45496.1 hypothetical protein HMPREF1541_09328 [Cyphellophora europaea CBS 101466]